MHIFTAVSWQRNDSSRGWRGGHPEKRRAPSRNGFWVASLPRAGKDRKRRSSVTPSFHFLKFTSRQYRINPRLQISFPFTSFHHNFTFLKHRSNFYWVIWGSTMRARSPILCRWIQFLWVKENWAEQFEQWSSCTRWWIEIIEDDDTQGVVRCCIPFVSARCEWLLTLAWWVLWRLVWNRKISNIRILRIRDWIWRNVRHPWSVVTKLSIEFLKINLTVPQFSLALLLWLSLVCFSVHAWVKIVLAVIAGDDLQGCRREHKFRPNPAP